MTPVYRAKDQAGLVLLDRNGSVVYRQVYPHQIYPDFKSIPPIVVDTLLFIENREMLDSTHPYRNPAIQWGRMSRAVVGLAIHRVDPHRQMIGGSTLATQLEKIRHSPEGRTSSVAEKARQMVSASLSAYRDGPRTLNAQEQIICDYINSIPLAATSRQGEVIGLADGLHDWYGASFADVNRLLRADVPAADSSEALAQARAYREVLSLFLALRQPSRDLVDQPAAFNVKTDSYLRTLSRNGVISPRLRDLALESRIPLQLAGSASSRQNFVMGKGPDAIRTALLPMLGLNSTYALDRLDLTAGTTLDKQSEQNVSHFLGSLSNADSARAAGLDQYQLLDVGDPKQVIYSVTIYERGKGANMLRVSTDNYDQPLNINRGTRLQLGSTAKLRTLINYLQIVEDLHGRFAPMPAAELKAQPVIPGDNITAWAIDYLSSANDRSLEAMLEAALQRKYSGSTGEAFFTAGGLHHFENFESSEDNEIMTVSEGFERSVNLVFIRLLRDIERYYIFRVPGASPAILNNQNNPARARYLERFADMEGRTFLGRFYQKYDGMTNAQALDSLVGGIRLTPLRAAVIFRSVRPEAGLDEFNAFLHAHLPASALAAVDAETLYTKYGPDKFNLNDRGYLARVHPLELWLLYYREQHPRATLPAVMAASTGQRQEVYGWLFKTRYKHAQDKRIETLLEIDAFKPIHAAWKRLGYPFDALVPSYATSIGVSGDTPQALAELAGILVNDGVRYPSIAIRDLHFAQNTPFDVDLKPATSSGEQVLSPVIARLVRQQMIGVVETGTGRRVSGGLKLADGTVLKIGGKTGTGDNRLEEFGARGALIGSRPVNRTAAFVFFIGDRLFGTVLAFVPGRDSAHYEFTSALAVQLLKDLEPHLEPLISAPPAYEPTSRSGSISRNVSSAPAGT